MDRRNDKSRKAITSALLELLDARALLEVSIEELSKSAGVSRSTFYRNFTSISAVLVEHMEDWFYRFEADLQTEMDNTPASEITKPENYISLFFAALNADRVAQIVFKGGGGQEALQLTYSRLRNTNLKLLNADFGNKLSPFDKEMVATVFAAAIMRVALELDALENDETRHRLNYRLAILIDTGVKGLERAHPLNASVPK